MPTRRYRVYVLDEHDVVRFALHELVSRDERFESVGTGASAADAERDLPTQRPDVVVLDIRRGDDGTDVCRALRSAHPDVRLLVFTAYDDERALFDAMLAGAAGLVHKRTPVAELLDAVFAVATGRSLLDPPAARRLIDRVREGRARDDRLGSLSDRERRILELLAEGLTNRQIAEHVHLAEKTVKNYVSGLLAKLGMERRTQAAVFATKAAARRIG